MKSRCRLARTHSLLFAFLFTFQWALQGSAQLEEIESRAKGLEAQGRFREALPLRQQALAIAEGDSGPNSAATAIALNRLAIVYLQMGVPEPAIPLLERARSFWKAHPSGAANVDSVTSNLAGAYMEAGKFEQAQQMFKLLLKARERTFGQSHLNTVSTLHNLGVVLIRSGKPAEALPLLERALPIMSKTTGANSADTAQTLSFLAQAYCDTGRLEKALPLAERAVAAFESSVGGEHPMTEYGLTVLSRCLRAMGNNELALGPTLRALAITEKASGPESPKLGHLLSDLSAIYNDLGRSDEAMAASKRSAAIMESSFGQDHPGTIGAYNNFAFALMNAGRLEEALPLLERSLAQVQKQFGENDAKNAYMLRNLSFVCEGLGQTKQAIDYSTRSLDIRSKNLGPHHPETVFSLKHLLNLLYKTGDNDQGKIISARLASARQSYLQDIVLRMDEDSRLAWQSWSMDFGPEVLLLDPIDVSQMVLRSKGVVLDSVCEDRATAENAKGRKAKSLLAEMSRLRQEVAQSALANDEAGLQKVKKSSLRIAEIERELAASVAGSGRGRRSANVLFSEIRNSLVSGEVLVEFFQFSVADTLRVKKTDRSYAALIIVPPSVDNPSLGVATDDGVEFISLGESASIDQAIARLRNALRKESGPSVALAQDLSLLRDRLLEPVLDKLPSETKRIIICPDGELNFLPFASLTDKHGRFVAELFNVAYASSGRDLVSKPSYQAPKNLAVFADPIFDSSGKASSAKEMVAMRSAEADVFGTINLPPLPGTKAEAEQLEVIAAGAGWDIKATTGEDATESNVREAKKPGVLHLATHGFYLNSFTPPAEDGTRGMSVVGLHQENDKKQNENGVDPMRASGVALTGAQQTLKLWSQRKAPDPETDGILTAEEVASLDLNGTWLVTLSACETGVGEARSGEGVFGLRRAFMMAGAENLLMTLWPVADDTTASIMSDFYKEALATGDAPGSLAKVQRDWLVKLREEKGLAAAIREAGPFAMVMMTAPTHPPVELPPIAKLEPKAQSAVEPSTQPTDKSTAEKKSSWWPF